MQKITTFLWYDGRAEEAAKHYVSIFEKSKITSVSRFGGKVMSVAFRLAGQEFIALNGGPHYQFTPAVSLFVLCKDQKEVDTKWKKLLSGGGKPSRCGWLTDKFGLSWQVIPDGLMECLQHPAGMQAMLQMEKLDIGTLREAAGIGPKKKKAKKR